MGPGRMLSSVTLLTFVRQVVLAVDVAVQHLAAADADAETAQRLGALVLAAATRFRETWRSQH